MGVWLQNVRTTVNGALTYQTRVTTAVMTRDAVLAFVLFAVPFGMVLRMTLLRWKRGWAVGLVLASLVMCAIALGATVRRLDRYAHFPSPYHKDLLMLMGLAFLSIVLGAAIVWPVWTLLVHAFLPKRTAHALLNWQRSLSDPVSALAR